MTDWTDVSMPLRPGMLAWPGDPPVRVEHVAEIATEGLMVSRLELGSHTGTHLDAPCHFVAGGKGIDEVPLWRLMGPCRVLDLQHVTGLIERSDLEPFHPQAGDRLLLKTRNAGKLRQEKFVHEYAALDLSAAQFLVERQVALVGIDYLSIERFFAPGHPVHVALLEKEVAVLEGVDLAVTAPGEYELIALPLRLEAGDGGPARVLLRPAFPASWDAPSSPPRSS